MAKRREANPPAPKKGGKIKPPKVGGRSVGRRGGR